MTNEIKILIEVYINSYYKLKCIQIKEHSNFHKPSSCVVEIGSKVVEHSLKLSKFHVSYKNDVPNLIRIKLDFNLTELGLKCNVHFVIG